MCVLRTKICDQIFIAHAHNSNCLILNVCSLELKHWLLASEEILLKSLL